MPLQYKLLTGEKGLGKCENILTVMPAGKFCIKKSPPKQRFFLCSKEIN